MPDEGVEFLHTRHEIEPGILAARDRQVKDVSVQEHRGGDTANVQRNGTYKVRVNLCWTLGQQAVDDEGSG